MQIKNQKAIKSAAVQRKQKFRECMHGHLKEDGGSMKLSRG
jgi:hypothetical protein